MSNLPQDHSQVLEDDAFSKPEDAGGDTEFSVITEFNEEDGDAQKAAVPAKAAMPATPAEDADADELPEDLRGKTTGQLAKMFKEAQSVIGRQGHELGQLRGLSDRLLKSTLTPQGLAKHAASARSSVTDADFFAKPLDSITTVIANHPAIRRIEEALGRGAQEREIARTEAAVKRFNEAHPDANDILASDDFRNWILSSPVRRELYKSAHNGYNFDAGNELFTTFKELRGLRAQREATAAANSQSAAAAKVQAQAKAAKVPTGGNAGSTKSTKGRQVYRRADLMELRVNDPDRYEALSAEIDAAYREGRVR